MKTILITGCSSGFGFDAAKFLAKKGHNVIASMRNVNTTNADAANELLAYAQSENVSISVLELDVTSDESVSNAAESLPTIDVLINNAGAGWAGPIEAFSSDQVLAQLDLNIVGTVRTAKAVLPGMREQGSGLIIQVSSVAGRGSFPAFGVYNASKWGLEGLSEAMRYELAHLGIDVVLVEPGPFETNFFGNMVGAQDESIATAYQHVMEYSESFGQQVQELYQNPDVPIDPQLVIDTFDKLIEMPNGSRPLRTIAGLDFGFQKINDATEPVRKSLLEDLGLNEWDGPQGY
ncbi:MAG: short-chain dehydrogenase/reductase [Bacteroidetes bacterium]|nr:short-chain dehydrogenase/reductase [Bacteroidota bacterium]